MEPSAHGTQLTQAQIHCHFLALLPWHKIGTFRALHRGHQNVIFWGVFLGREKPWL